MSDEQALVPVRGQPPAQLDKSAVRPVSAQAVRRAEEMEAETVPHLGIEGVRALAEACAAGARGARRAERDRLLVLALFDGALRISELLGVAPQDLVQTPEGWVVRIMGKGRRPGEVALSPSLVAQLHSYAYRRRVEKASRFFPFNRSRAHQIIAAGFARAGLQKPHGVGSVHVLRHSGALARLAATGNPKALQDHLRHRSAKMTLRYMKTLSAKESLRIQHGVDFKW